MDGSSLSGRWDGNRIETSENVWLQRRGVCFFHEAGDSSSLKGTGKEQRIEAGARGTVAAAEKVQKKQGGSGKPTSEKGGWQVCCQEGDSLGFHCAEKTGSLAIEEEEGAGKDLQLFPGQEEAEAGNGIVLGAEGLHRLTTRAP